MTGGPVNDSFNSVRKIAKFLISRTLPGNVHSDDYWFMPMTMRWIIIAKDNDGVIEIIHSVSVYILVPAVIADLFFIVCICIDHMY
jgi:hypothetical protein